ncbi:hypothetical protein QYM36_016080, partial [Artemia franciscana]
LQRQAPMPLIYDKVVQDKTQNQDAREGAQTTIYLAVSEKVEGITGKYFVDCK